MPFQDMDLIDSNLKYLQLRLLEDSPPISQHLAVFVKDPNESDQYWLRLLTVEEGTEPPKKGLSRFLKYNPPFRRKPRRYLYGTGFPEQEHGNIIIYDLGDYNSTPITKDGISTVIRNIEEGEVKPRKAPKTWTLDAIIGFAEYTGPDPLSIDEIAILVGYEYHQRRSAYFS